MAVIAMDDTKWGRRGHFAGFTGLSEWYLDPFDGGERETYVCDQLEVPASTATACIEGRTRGTFR